MTHIFYHPVMITSYFCPFHFWRVRSCVNSQMSRSRQSESVFTKQVVRALREQSGATSWIKQSLAVWGTLTQEIQGAETETVISEMSLGWEYEEMRAGSLVPVDCITKLLNYIKHDFFLMSPDTGRQYCDTCVWAAGCVEGCRTFINV